MAATVVEVRPTIDRAWLERAAARDPVTHAFALWDLEWNPGRIRFFSALEGDATVGYLLVWLGHPRAPVVHWFGTGPGSERLAEWLPTRPCVAIVPEKVVAEVEAARGPGRRYRELILTRERGTAWIAPDEKKRVRRLTRADVPLLEPWARRQDDPVVAEYPFIDPEVDIAWGAFEGDRLVGATRAEVRLPRVWVLGGVYVEPAARGRGWGRELLGAALRTAEMTGAKVALYVRVDREPARALYESVGFRPVGRRVWIDLGADLAP